MADVSLFGNIYNPDVLTCLANLSSDEVFTPPDIANAMLDLLPQELFENPDTKFLDPACKSGVFLREIAKRLIKGLELQIPDLQERLDHILHNQLYGIAITELTSLIARRSLYCSKYPNSEYSVSKFNNAQGNIRFKKIQHTWNNRSCIFCGASQTQYDRDEELETHAYEFIHTNNPEEILNMHFDVIIGNPPYQLSDGGAQASAIPIYHEFISNAIKLEPRYLCMITPSRWFSGGRGLDSFRKEMLSDNRLKIIHDFPDAQECFPGVEIKGGVSYFLWDKQYSGGCEVNTHQNGQIISKMSRPLLEDGCDVFIRNNNLIDIFRKVIVKQEESFMSIVSSMKPFGYRGDLFKNPAKYDLPDLSETPIKGGYTIYGLDSSLHRTKKYAKNTYPIPRKEYVDGFKLFMPRNQGSGLLGECFSTPIFAKPNDLCTETFVVIGTFKTEKEMNNCFSYICTKFFRTMIAIRKIDQGMGQNVYKYVPMQDFSKPWTDKELYEKYGLSEEEIDFIETNVKEMSSGGES